MLAMALSTLLSVQLMRALMQVDPKVWTQRISDMLCEELLTAGALKTRGCRFVIVHCRGRGRRSGRDVP